jgi:flagellar biogenesis protein FliO
VAFSALGYAVTTVQALLLILAMLLSALYYMGRLGREHAKRMERDEKPLSMIRSNRERR